MALFGKRFTTRLAILTVVSLAATGVGSVAQAVTTVPAAPWFVAASPGNTRAVVSWGVPASDGGSAVTNYVITPYLGTTALAKKTVGVVKQATIEGLTNGKRYTFDVAAINAAGTGTPRSSPATVVGSPVAPTQVYADQGGDQAGGATATVHWTVSPNNGWAITSYVVTPIADGVAMMATCTRRRRRRHLLRASCTGRTTRSGWRRRTPTARVRSRWVRSRSSSAARARRWSTVRAISTRRRRGRPSAFREFTTGR